MRDILIVEDGKHERERLERLFRQHNYSVSSAESATEAELLITHEEYRLVILDIGLGDRSGSYVFQLIKQTKKNPYIIMLTGNPSIHLKKRFIEEGALAYIVKASNEAANSALIERVKSILGAPSIEQFSGIDLRDFIKLYLNADSANFFYTSDDELIPCSECEGLDYVVTFGHKTQMPPKLEGCVICKSCGKQMDVEVT